jgi:hypothetical protein
MNTPSRVAFSALALVGTVTRAHIASNIAKSRAFMILLLRSVPEAADLLELQSYARRPSSLPSSSG